MSTVKNYAMNDAAIQAELALASMGIEKTDTQTEKPRAKKIVKANAGQAKKHAAKDTSATIPVSSDAEIAASETMAKNASIPAKNKRTKKQIEMTMNDAVIVPENDAVIVPEKPAIFPENETNGASVGLDHDAAQLKLVPRIAGKLRLCRIEKYEDKRNPELSFQEMTTSTITFAPMYLTEKRIPVKVQYRMHRLYVNGETRVSALHTATTKGIVDTSKFDNEREKSVYCGDIMPELIRYTYLSIVAGYERLNNAIQHVTGQAQRGEKLIGHDETYRATTAKFLTNFAKATIQAEKQPMSDSELHAKAQAQALQIAETLRNETGK